MPEINMQEALPIPPVTAATVMHQAVEAMKTLRVDLRDLGFPDVGYIAVPITLEIGQPRAETPSIFPLTIRAERHPEAFPVFEGQVGADAVGPSSATLWIGGTYTPPMHQAGVLLDAALLSNVANHALRNFVSELAAEVTRRAREREFSEVRAHRME